MNSFSPLVTAIGVAAFALAVTSFLSVAGVARSETRSVAVSRVQAWRVAFLVVAGAAVSGWRSTCVVFGFVSFFALREFLTLASTRREDRLVVLWVYCSVLISYWSIWIDVYPYFLVIVPVYVFVITALLMALTGRSDGFLATACIMHWGVIICVYNLGHAAFLARTPAAEAGPSGPAGLVFFLLAATALADSSQHLADRWLGRHPIGVRMLRGATWEGLGASLAITGLSFVFAARFFSPLAFWPAVFVGALFPLWAAAGRLTMAAVMHDLGVRNSSLLVPGAGGALDAIAGLTFTAPWYFHMHAIFALERF